MKGKEVKNEPRNECVHQLPVTAAITTRVTSNRSYNHNYYKSNHQRESTHQLKVTKAAHLVP